MLLLDTATMPASERAEAYFAIASGESGSCSVEHEDDGDRLWKRLEVWRFGPLTLFATQGSGMRIRRTARHARFDSSQTVSVITQSAGRGAFSWNGHQQRVTADTLVLAHKTAGYEYGWSGSGLSVAFMVGADELGLPEDMVRTAIPLLSSSRIRPLLLNHVRAVHADADRLSTEAGAAAIGDSTLHLTRALVASVAADRAARRTIAEETLLTRVLAYARAHLTDPQLTPQRIAHVHNVSLRTLYRACEDAELSLEKWIIRQRLQGARRDLAASEHAHRTIAAICRSWGFTSPGYFSRRFHDVYGTTPRQWRRHNLN
ncbi:helix-turn-helix domain-containing protein [Microbispora bryophytorum]|uniref:Helix-turn-helix domain-containing protein n=1 Tax=Microbispora bryophytorum subsp. camponoti TaxID=1677852 RepID=A0ABR8KTU7_9ACTN|nr:helix-turn-helix domain-containing protein [Microbispora camponoti]MBD3142176.1 helix-turn-helix domain-containing protein [Microbispora camponoti]